MDKPADDKERKVIPRWRSIVRTPNSELTSSRQLVGIGLSADEIIGDAREQWDLRKDQFSALELIYAAQMFGRDSDASSAAHFLLSTEVRPDVRRLSEAVLGQEPPAEPEAPRDVVKSAKASLVEYPRNPVLRTQLALAYATQGQKKRALFEMQRALALAPSNRTVVRSSTRLFVHSGRGDEALNRLLRLADSSDPWIISALVATADLQDDRRAISPRKIGRLLDSGLPPYQLAELAAALATLEVQAGNIKRAKKILAPQLGGINENVAAQLRWLERKHRVNFGVDILGVAGTFEASTLELSARGEFQAALQSARLWHKDEPFAARAAIQASYMSSTFVRDFEVALKFLEPALQANPTNTTLLNNKAYALSELRRFAEATSTLDQAMSIGKSGRDPVLMATRANIIVRSGDVLGGGMQYIDAIEEAVKQKLVDVQARITIHLLKEMIEIGYGFSASEITKLDRLVGNRSLSEDTRQLYKHLVADRIHSPPGRNDTDGDTVKRELLDRLDGSLPDFEGLVL
jgi:tetratricopeptide (TPR) repeat protein